MARHPLAPLTAWLRCCAVAGLLLICATCGGGGGTGNSFVANPGTLPAGEPLVITTSGALLPALQGVAYSANLAAANGTPPLRWAAESVLPPGLALDPGTGLLSGRATISGRLEFTIAVTDSSSPAKSARQTFAITIVFPLTPASQTFSILLNQNVSLPISVQGGMSPFTFRVSGGLPPGLELDSATGFISGSATAAGSYGTNVNIQDSLSPPESIAQQVSIVVKAPLGRNDTPATATPIANGTINASISPFIDPPNGAPAAGDIDYYRGQGVAGQTVHVETTAKRITSGNPLNTILEITDANGIRLSTCRWPGDTSNNFNNFCFNDDISSGVKDSALDLRPPGSANAITTFFVRVLDWRGDARPDMVYRLAISGVLDPLKITAASAGNAKVNTPYIQQLAATGGVGPYAWSLVSGTLPAGYFLSPSGLISGATVALGTFQFTVRVADAANPQQNVTANFIITVSP